MRLVPSDYHLQEAGPSFWQPQKGYEKCIFETLHDEIKCVLSTKESNFNEKMGQNFYICLRSGPRGLTPPYGQPDHKNTVVFFDDRPKCEVLIKNNHWKKHRPRQHMNVDELKNQGHDNEEIKRFLHTDRYRLSTHFFKSRHWYPELNELKLCIEKP